MTWLRRISAACLLSAIMLSSMPGCAQSPRRRSDWADYDRNLKAKRTNARPGEVANREILAAVEAFLERTGEYERGSAEPHVNLTAGTPTARSNAAEAPRLQPRTLREPPPSELNRTARSPIVANAQVALKDVAPPRPRLALPMIRFVSLRDPSVAISAPANDARKEKTANEPLSTDEETGSVSPDRLVSYLEEQAKDGTDFDAEWRLRMTQLALQRDQDALELSPTLPASARELLTALFRTATAVRRAARDPLSDAAETLESVEKLRAVVADRADPVVSSVALCRKVVTFGIYEQMDSSAFIAGRPIQTIVYSEIRGFRSDPKEGGRFETRLATRLEVLSSDGRSMWQHEEPEIIDICRRRRTDFFIAQRITLPANLPAGDYVLKVWIEDKLSGRADEATYEFEIRSAGTIQNG